MKEMRCPSCGRVAQTETCDSRDRRRTYGRSHMRRCLSCGYKYKTVERVDPRSFNTFEEYVDSDPERKRANIERIERMADRLSIKLAAN